MIVDTASDFINALKNLKPSLSAAKFPKQLMLIQPNSFSISPHSATDNFYMQTQSDVDIKLALAQHTELTQALKEFLPVKIFAGREASPDSVFLNNIFASSNNHLIIGAMHHQHRQKEAEHDDIIEWFKSNGYDLINLNTESVTAELTGSLIIDHTRNIGYCGLSERCNRAGAEAMHKAFDLDLTFMFKLQKTEYHTNVILSILADKALIIHPSSFTDPNTANAIIDLYSPNTVILNDEEKNAFCGNAIAISENHLWLSGLAHKTLSSKNKTILSEAGFKIKSVDLSEIEKAGSSLRCCIMEVF